MSAFRWEANVEAKAIAANDLTTPGFWDANWKPQSGGLRVIQESDPDYGRNGTVVRQMRRYAPSVIGRGSVVELGGGGASYRLLALAKWAGARVTAVDYSKEGIRQTADLFRLNGCEVQTVLSDFFRWDPQGRTYDAVTHWGVAEHFTDPTELFELSARVLKRSGVLFFTMPNMAAFGAHLWRRWNPENWSAHHYHTDDVIVRACRRAGLRVSCRFHFGRPLLQLTPWECPGLLPSAVTMLRSGTNAVHALWPRIFERGLPWLSMHRAYVCRHR